MAFSMNTLIRVANLASSTAGGWSQIEFKGDSANGGNWSDFYWVVLTGI